LRNIAYLARQKNKQIFKNLNMSDQNINKNIMEQVQNEKINRNRELSSINK
jgi:hypothetical protein